jgi:glycosyltransferase involved in cell wall biosynthesis
MRVQTRKGNASGSSMKKHQDMETKADESGVTPGRGGSVRDERCPSSSASGKLASTEPLVSVVTPVHNGAKYLGECIASILNQTYQNWEYTIFNNCSTDQTLEIAESYARKDRRIRVYTNPKLVGVIESHNLALSHISPQSKYCKILHADDWLYPICIAEMVKVAEDHPEVGIVGAYGLRGKHVVWDGLPHPSTVVPGREICRRSLMGGFYVFGSPSSHMVRADYIRQTAAFYAPNEFHVPYADQEACYRTLATSDFGFVHQVLSYTRESAESLTSTLEKRKLNNDLPSQLTIFAKYGPQYLSREEYKQRRKILMGRYYRFLGSSLLHHRDRQFWSFHKRALANAGLPLSKRKLWRAMGAELVHALLNPRTLISKALRRS